MYSTIKNSAGPHITRLVITLYSTHQATQWTANRATTRPATPPPIYRAVSPPSPTYQATPKAYLTVQNLYMRYAPLKFIHSAPKLAPKIASYLTVQDLYNRFKFSKKPHYGTANRTAAFGPKQLPKSAPLMSKASAKSIEKNIGKAVDSTKIGPSGTKPAFDSKISSMNSFWASHSNAKTPFSLRQKWNTQALTMQSPCYMKSAQHAPMVNISNSVFRSYTTPPFNLAIAISTPARLLKQSAYDPAKPRTFGLSAT